jgi:hypothetical protein
MKKHLSKAIEMNENPLQQKETQEVFYFPFHVCYVYLDSSDRHDPVFKSVKDFCDRSHIPIYCRLYDSKKYSEDCDDIESLPAFHVYMDGSDYPEETFYPTSHPLRKINSYIVRWQIQLEHIQIHRAQRERQKQSFLNFIKSFFVKKTRMEKLAEKAIRI